jgi:hypothetical protein
LGLQEPDTAANAMDYDKRLVMVQAGEPYRAQLFRELLDVR